MPRTRLTVVSGRQRVERLGLYFAVIAGKRRSVYQQLDGKIELADLCSCRVDWTPDFEVERSPACVIDQHRKQAIDEEWRDAG
jgi:hypothetical protein